MSVEIHRKVKDAVDELSRDTEYVCLNIESVAEKAGVDTRTAKLHLKIMQEYGVGKFCDPKGKTFSRTPQKEE